MTIEMICRVAILVASLSLLAVAFVRAFQNIAERMLRASEPDLEFKATHTLAVTPGSKMEVMVTEEGHVIYKPPHYDDLIGLGLVADFPGILFPIGDE